MTQSPKITTILAVPGLSPVAQQAASPGIISIGLVLDGQTVVWGDCLAAGATCPDAPPPFAIKAGFQTIQTVIAPALRQESLTHFRPLAQKIDQLSESTPSGEDLIHPALRYGLSQALLAAVARTHDVTMAERLATEYDLPRPAQPIPIQTEIEALALATTKPLILRRLAAFSHTPAITDPAADLGRNGEYLQRYTRRLKTQISQTYPQTDPPSSSPAIHLTLRGGLGQLYEHNIGRVLGDLVGLEKTTSPYHLRVEDPLLLDSRPAHLEALADLKAYLRLRQMETDLVAAGWVDSLDAVKAVIEADAAHMLRLTLPALGGLDQTITAILACQGHGLGVLLDPDPAATPRTTEIALHLALATQPTLLTTAPPPTNLTDLATIHNEMTRLLTWIAARPPA